MFHDTKYATTKRERLEAAATNVHGRKFIMGTDFTWRRVSERRLKLARLQNQMQAIWDRIEEREGDFHSGIACNPEKTAATIEHIWERFRQLEAEERELLRPGLMLADDDTEPTEPTHHDAY